MTRSNPGILHSFDPEIERTRLKLLKLRKEHNTTHSQFTSQTSNMANNQERTLKELAAPDVGHQPLCIQIPQLQEGVASYELKYGLIHLLPKFHGLAGEDPHKHLMEFHVVCSTMRPVDVLEDFVKMKAFPFSLCDIAKDWLYLQPTPICTWSDMKRRFLEKLFPASRTVAIRKEINGIRQLQGENLYEYWERFNKLCSTCPNHQINEQLLIQYFYEGLMPMERSMIDAASGGALMDKTLAAARYLISNMAKNSQQFSSRNLTTRVVHEASISSVAAVDNQRLENKLTELTSLVRQLAMGQAIPQIQQTCGIRAGDHYTDSCPQLQETAQPSHLVAGIHLPHQSHQQQPQQYNPFSPTYNPGWRSHPNLRYGPPAP
ncbi:uncharacterized protein LOC113857365 [Abrus precatorius]|uniref:Uncharacterized protein LOC113857365 n=1 Tax=Abrus precatorius TaxID=3816 RepID=A0A8B8KNR2_ABRPR|nr:uncharacterized protein LOC113857365 [Abrus precatorius]